MLISVQNLCRLTRKQCHCLLVLPLFLPHVRIVEVKLGEAVLSQVQKGADSQVAVRNRIVLELVQAAQKLFLL